MAQCKQCGRKKLFANFARRLDIPEMRNMVSHWPWHTVRICPQCLSEFDRQFTERVQFLAPQIMAENADVTQPVCLMCGTQSTQLAYTQTGRWVDPAGLPAAGKFHVCQQCRGRIISDGVISSTEIEASPQFERLLAAIPLVQPATVLDIDGWDIADNNAQPDAAAEVIRNLSLVAAVNIAETWWSVAPRCIADAPGTPTRAAMLTGGDAATAGAHGKIPTHLVLAWRTLQTDQPAEMDMWVYRLPTGYTIVRFDPRPA